MSTGKPEGEDAVTSRIVGSLDFYIVPNVEGWHGSLNEGGRNLGIKFNGADWEALFLDALRCPEPEPYVQGENIDEYERRSKRNFQQAISKYPMLSRIWDLYEDVTYTPEEAKQLREECIEIQPTTTDPRVSRALAKLIYASDEALKTGYGLFLASD